MSKTKKTQTRKSAFEAWFRAQFGRLPMSPAARRGLQKDLELAEHRLEQLRRAIEIDNTLLNCQQAALYAWNVKQADKSKTEW